MTNAAGSKKLKSWENPLNIICPCKWMEDCVKSSVLMKDWPTFLIPNHLPTNIYKTWLKKIARELFKLPKEKFLLMFGSLDTKDPRKGNDLLCSALEILSKTKEIEFEVIVLDKYQKIKNNNISFKKHFMDSLYDDQSISIIYFAADLMVVP